MHLTDPHLFADPQGALRGAVTYDSLQAVLAHYRDSGWQADIAVVTGDLVQDDSAGAYTHFRESLAPLGMPVHCLPGNHDVPALMRDALSEEPFHYCRPVERAGWLIAYVDSCVPGIAGGAISNREYERLEQLIAASDAEHVMVCLHHPPVAMNSKWLDTVGLKDGDEFLRRLGIAGKVRLAVFGHVHQEYDAEHNGMRIIATPSTCRQFAKGSDEFAVDDNPPAYRRITLKDNGDFDTELVWIETERHMDQSGAPE